MGLKAAYIMPHPPLAVDGIGGETEKSQIPETLFSYHKLAKEIAALRPDTIILTSPHATMYTDYFHVSPGPSARGNFAVFGIPGVGMECDYDREFVERLEMFCDDSYFPAGTQGEREPLLDHGTMVPLFFVNQCYTDYDLVRIGLSGLPLKDHFLFGKFIKKVMDSMDKSYVLIASGDLSHHQSDSGPYEFRKEGPLYDKMLMDTLKKGDLKGLLGFDEGLLSRAGECGHRSFCILAGCLEDEEVRVRTLSHEAPFGVGYGFAAMEIKHSAGKDHQLKENNEMKNDSLDPYVSLAVRTINAQVNGRDLPRVDDDIPSELKNKRAGAFVSIHKNGELRGCIGTILATRKSVAEEIIANAVSASTRDPRFPEIIPSELPLLEINVDVLSEPEIIHSPELLDPEKYGVIVQNGSRLGVLLPDLEGIDTVEQQLAIAKRKAGIAFEEPVELMRFTVERHI